MENAKRFEDFKAEWKVFMCWKFENIVYVRFLIVEVFNLSVLRHDLLMVGRFEQIRLYYNSEYCLEVEFFSVEFRFSVVLQFEFWNYGTIILRLQRTMKLFRNGVRYYIVLTINYASSMDFFFLQFAKNGQSSRYRNHEKLVWKGTGEKLVLLGLHNGISYGIHTSWRTYQTIIS